MAFNLPAVSFDFDAFSPVLTRASFESHYHSHHASVLEGTNALVADDRALQGRSIEEVIQIAARESGQNPARQALLFNASQHWNHSLYWLSLSAPNSSRPSQRVRDLIDRSFGSYAAFEDAFVKSALGRIGSGWVWIVKDGDKLAIESTGNYDTPVAHGRHALITCDVWEHTYYLDYKNNRKVFVRNFLEQLINWDTLEARFDDEQSSLDPGRA